MSRSYRRPWVRDGFHSKKHTKQIFNRRYRRVCRTLTKSCLRPAVEILNYWFDDEVSFTELIDMIDPSYPHPKTFSNSYDICDYRCYTPKWDRAYRK